MRSDFYFKMILTVIAIELGWLGAKELATPVTAQQAATPVVITGIQVNQNDGTHLPVVVLGSERQVPPALTPTVQPLVTRLTMPAQPLKVEIDRPVKVEADKPLRVDQIRYTPGDRPGE
jgi:hypothetical protein